MINGHTQLFGIIGNPVEHSFSPAMHNAAFAELGMNGVYIPMRPADLAEGFRGLRSLGFIGVSVTVPFKVAVMEFLDKVDPVARNIGAVNTLLFERDGDHCRCTGYNTDWLGSNQALGEELQLAGSTVLILGAGGAARAVAHAVSSAGGRVTLFNRTPARGEALASDLGVGFRPLGEFHGGGHQILINTTPVGMKPHSDATPVPADRLAPELTVMDIVYNPLKTRLLRQAEAAGCAVIDGLGMFVYQGAMQFECWTGIEAPVAMMRLVVEAELGCAPGGLREPDKHAPVPGT